MRKYYLVCYDVSDAKRLRRTHKLMRGFGDPLQYSVFICFLSKVEKVVMLSKLNDEINSREDRVLVVDIGPDSKRTRAAIEYFGIQEKLRDEECFVL
ncbi:MAG: CRISPR-associated endonuclease Cas2 [Actinobacteria bacterium]|nr:CRISPR-associated endonuclease Cas2 [Actinomycetota bacterium]